MKKKLMIFLVLSLLLVSGCSSSDESSDGEKKKTDMEKMDFSDEPENVIYLAGRRGRVVAKNSKNLYL